MVACSTAGPPIADGQRVGAFEEPAQWSAQVSSEPPIQTVAVTKGAGIASRPAGIASRPAGIASRPAGIASGRPGITTGGIGLPKGGGYHKIGKPYEVKGIVYVPRHEPAYEETGIASWYGENFHGGKTANGEVYDMHALTAAHKTLPLPSLVMVTNVSNGRSVMVRVNDRGPFKKGRIIDVSARVAKELGFAHLGLTTVSVKYIGPAPLDGSDHHETAHLAKAGAR